VQRISYATAGTKVSRILMPPRPASGERDTATWEFGLPRGAVGVRAHADRNLRRDGAVRGGWRATGERACFPVAMEELGGRLPAGWYWLELELQLGEEVAAVPCLYPTYASGADGDAQIPLPEPDSRGRVR